MTGKPFKLFFLILISILYISCPAPSPFKDSLNGFTEFYFDAGINGLSSNGTGRIDGNNITVTVPGWTTGLDAIKASFKYNGEKVYVGTDPQTSGADAQDFRDSVTYQIVGIDGSIENYTVTVVIDDKITYFDLPIDGILYPIKIDPSSRIIDVTIAGNKTTNLASVRPEIDIENFGSYTGSTTNCSVSINSTPYEYTNISLNLVDDKLSVPLVLTQTIYDIADRPANVIPYTLYIHKSTDSTKYINRLAYMSSENAMLDRDFVAVFTKDPGTGDDIMTLDFPQEFVSDMPSMYYQFYDPYSKYYEINFSVAAFDFTQSQQITLIAQDGSSRIYNYVANIYTYGYPVAGSLTMTDVVDSYSFTIDSFATTDPESQTLQYKVVASSDSSKIDTIYKVENITSGSELIQNWSTSTSALTVNVDADSTNYNVTVLAKDTADNITMYSGSVYVDQVNDTRLADITGLQTNTGLDPTFSCLTNYSYSLTDYIYTLDKINITASLNDSGAMHTIEMRNNNSVWKTATEASPLELDIVKGYNTIEIRVTSSDSMESTSYYISFTKPDYSSTSILYVTPSASTYADGKLWGNALDSLQLALNIAKEYPSSIKQIWVAAGVYYPEKEVGGVGTAYRTFQLVDGVKLYGGFAGYEGSVEDRDINNSSNYTILSGDVDGTADTKTNDIVYTYTDIAGTGNSNHIINNTSVVLSSGNTRLDGFIITAGYSTTENGAGMLNDSDKLIVANCKFVGNYANNGGAVFNNGSDIDFVNCHFYSNYAGINGGAIFNTNGTNITITNAAFNNNVVGNWAASIYDDSVNTALYNNLTVYSPGANSIYLVNTSNVIEINNSILDTSILCISTSSTNTYIQKNYRNGSVGGGGTFSLVDDMTGIVAYSNTSSTVFDGLIPNAGSATEDVGTPSYLPLDIADLNNNEITSEKIPFDIRGTGNPRDINGIDIGAYESNY